MPVIAVVNRKGGSGKSTFAAHVAAWCARQGHAVMLGDLDRQQSSRAWLRQRPPDLPGIAPWTIDQRNVLRVPTGITHVVLDTPGGLQGFELARVVMFADAIIIPVCPSLFDREAAAATHEELATLPRVTSGRCRVAGVGMRIDSRTRAADALREWAQARELPWLGTLRETQAYVRCLERGLTLFDLPPPQADLDLAQWGPVIDWLRPLLQPPAAVEAPPPRTATPSRLAPSLVPRLQPAQESLAPGGRLSSVLSGPRVLPPVVRQPPVARPSGLRFEERSLLLKR